MTVKCRLWLLFLSFAVIALAASSCVLAPALDQASGNGVAPTSDTGNFTMVAPTNSIATMEAHTSQVQATSSFKNAVQFSEADCACGGLTVSSAEPWGEYLECRYDWSGKNIDDNQLGFVVNRINHPDDWNRQFESDKQDIFNEVGYSSDPNAVVNPFLDEAGAYGVMVTETRYSRDGNPIDNCGVGKSEMSYADNWFVLVDLRSCEAPNTMNGYIDLLHAVQQCAVNLIDAKK